MDENNERMRPLEFAMNLSATESFQGKPFSYSVNDRVRYSRDPDFMDNKKAKGLWHS